MSAIARLLAGRGHEVTGSDLHPGPTLDRLVDVGVRTWAGHRPDALRSADFVVASSAVPESDPERRAAARLGIPVWDRPQLLEVLTGQTPTIGATGTHGKTTSTGLMLFAARGIGLDPSFVIGGELVGLDTNAGVGADDLLVLEVDEAFGTFLEIHLRGLVVTNLEADHLDYYQTVERLEDAFVDVVRRVDGPVVLCADDPGARRIAARTHRPTYGLSADASIRIDEVDVDGSGVRFRFEGRSVVVSKPGVHIARNAAGVLALTCEFGWDIDAAIEGLREFRGVKRRFELVGEVAGVTIIDDYAHLPTEIATNLDAARNGPWKRIWAVFQPHRYTRTRELHREFGGAFDAADEVVITNVYPADERPIPGVSGEMIADAIRVHRDNVSYVPDRGDVAAFVAGSVRDGDLVLTFGAGDISGLGPELIELLERR